MELDEHEQGERVRAWLRQNGSSLILGIALGLALVFGFKWWQGKGATHQLEAAKQYQLMADAVAAKDAAKVQAFATQLTGDFGDTAYGALARLRQAAFLADTGKTAEAIKLLQATPEKERADLAEIRKTRLARLLLVSGKADEAGKVLAGIATPSFPEVSEELRGDIALAKGDRDAARKAYENALTHLDQAAATRQLVELKLIDAGGQPPAKPET
jgi:predicted negative regulator of RcsB-dependent stress response